MNAARADGAGFEWTFVAPEAELLDASHRVVGRHGAGPSWEADDGSRVIGAVKARVDAPAGGAIPWLLLSVKRAAPTGLFRGVTSIQRVNTEGGLAPATACDDALRGTTVRVPYTADYLFYRAG